MPNPALTRLRPLLFALLAALLTAPAAFAEPFVWPAEWNADFEEVARGGTLRGATQSGSATFNPIMVAGSDLFHDLTVYETGLVRRDAATREIIPYAAESFEISEDGLTVDVTLREEIAWSDGTPVTAADYLFYYTAVTDPDVQASRASDFTLGGEPIVVEQTGDYALRFTFPQVDRQALSALGALYAAPDHILGEIYRSEGAEALSTAWNTDTPVEELVSAGPFVLTEYVPDERYTFERNEAYGAWNVDDAGTPLPYLAERQFTIAELPAQLNLYIAGETDSYSTASLDSFSVVLNAVEQGELEAETFVNLYSSDTMTFYVFNQNQADEPAKQELFRDVRFRRAMSHLTDREALLDLVIGIGEPSYGPVHPAYVTFHEPDTATYPYDPEAALELLAELGYSETDADGFLVNEAGERIEFTLASIASNDNAMQAVQVITDTMREFGVDAEPLPLEFSVLVDQLTSGDPNGPFDAIYIFFGCCTEEWPFFEGIFQCGGEFHMWNQSGECIDETEQQISDLVARGRATLDDAEAQAIASEIQQLFAEQQYMIFTTGAGIHSSWLPTVGGEFPMDLITTLNGPREVVNTFLKDAE